MNDTKDLAEVAANTLMYKCCHCEHGGLSRDEVTEVKKQSGAICYLCDKCKSDIKNLQTEDIE